MPALSHSAMIDLCSTLNNLGLYVHQQKSVLTTTTCLKFLGFFIDTSDMTITLTPDKIQKYFSTAHRLLEQADQ